MIRAFFALALLVSCTVQAPAQTANQWLFQKKNTGAGFTAYGVTGTAGRAFGLDGSGNLTMLSVSGGGGAGLDNIASSVTGNTLTLAGTLTAGRILTFRDLAGTVALTSDLSSYLTTAAAASAYQPLDSDLTSIAALTTTTHGRSLLTGADAAASRSALGLGTLATQSATISDYLTTANAASTYQPLDGDLTSIAALTTTTHGRSLLTGADAAASRSALGLGTLATQSATISDYLTTAAAASAYQPLDSDLTSIAALTTTTHGRALLTGADAAATRSTLGLGTLATQSATISDYLTTATAASTYAELAGATFAGLVNASAGLMTGTVALTGLSEITYEHASALGTVTSKILLNADQSTERDAVTWYLRHNLGGTIALLSDLEALNGSNITSGTVPAARLGTGTSISSKYLRGDNTWQTISGGGDALTSGTLAQFASTTSAQLRGVLSDESGTGEFLTTNGSAASLTSFPTLNQNTTGNAATATALQTGRTINGVTFDGTANITVPAAADTLTSTALNPTITESSLTSVGTLTSGVWHASPVEDAYISSASVWNSNVRDIARMSNLTTNGFVKTSGGNGVLSIDTATYLTTTGNGGSLTGLTQSQVTGLTTTDRPQFANTRIAHSALSYAATTNLDLDGDGFQTVSLTGNITFTTSNRAAGRSKTVRIISDASSRTLTFPAGWVFVGAAAPSSIAASKTAVLTVTFFGTADTDAVAAYAVQP